MQEPLVRDLASRGGPESCVRHPRGRSETLTGVHAGRLLSLENSIVHGADASWARKAIPLAALLRVAKVPRGRQNPPRT
jgi:hypothetical protein